MLIHNIIHEYARQAVWGLSSFITRVWLCTCAIISSPFSRQLSPILKQRAAADRSSVYLRGEVSDWYGLELCGNRVSAQGNSAHLVLFLLFIFFFLHKWKPMINHKFFIFAFFAPETSRSHIDQKDEDEKVKVGLCGSNISLIRTIDLNGQGDVRESHLVKFEIRSQKIFFLRGCM